MLFKIYNPASLIDCVAVLSLRSIFLNKKNQTCTLALETVPELFVSTVLAALFRFSEQSVRVANAKIPGFSFRIYSTAKENHGLEFTRRQTWQGSKCK